MITSMFYYNHYKPYMFKAKKADKVESLENKKNAPATQTKVETAFSDNASTKRLLLNKALNRDVVDYAHDLSHNVTSLKDAAKNINYDIEGFAKDTRKYGFDQTKKALKSNINTFVDTFNKAYSFFSTQSHSQSLVDFSVDIDNTVISQGNSLNELGVALDADNKVQFDKDAFDNLSPEQLESAMKDTKSAFEGLYQQSSKLLSMPLSEHMNFKGLNYYYNYKYGAAYADTFKIIESGMIIDKVV